MIIHLLAILLIHSNGQPGPLDGWPPRVPTASTTQARDTILPPSVTGSRDETGAWTLTFAYEPEDGMEAKRVALAGSFNHWSRSASPMRLGNDGTWTTRISLPDGTHWYKFVIDDELWREDPRNPETEPDGHGGSNTVLRLGHEANVDADHAQLGDGSIDAAGLAHEPRRPVYLQRLHGAAWLVRFRSLSGDVQAVTLVRPGRPGVRMHPVLANERFQWWEATVAHQSNEAVPYTFIIQDGERLERFPVIHTMSDTDKPMFTTPDWARDATWYQVMVDRFRNGNPANDPDPMRPWTSSWYESSPWEDADGQTFYEYYVFARRYGGDLQGLLEKLDYLSDLGVNALYLNPVFQADSPHKYNATSYIHIDEAFGQGGDYTQAERAEDLLDPSTWTWTKSDRIFLDFLQQAKARGFHVIIDGVFNHVGIGHPAFRDVLEHGQDSRYADWFAITSWDPLEYDCWGGFTSLPIFRKDDEHGIASEEVRDHIMQITRRWMDPDGDGDPSDGIDGWRLDVPNEVPRPFWIQWRAHVKSINPDAYITGEIWTRADEWLDGETFDAVMNYPFAASALAWIGNKEQWISPTELDRRLAELRMAYPEAATAVMQNLLDSHDTDRLVSKIHNPDRAYDEGNREQGDSSYDGSKPPVDAYRRARLAALLQMTYVGAPMVYYGDELGTWGSDDPNNRKPMPWPDLEPFDDVAFQAMPEHLDFYRRALAMRRGSVALRRGDFKTVHLHDDNNTWAFVRSHDGEEMLIALNASEQDATIELPDLGTGWEPVLVEPTGAGVQAPPVLAIPALGGAVWRRQP